MSIVANRARCARARRAQKAIAWGAVFGTSTQRKGLVLVWRNQEDLLCVVVSDAYHRPVFCAGRNGRNADVETV